MGQILRLSSVTLIDVAGENQFVPICLFLLSLSRARVASVIRRVHGTRPRFVFLNGTRANTLAKLSRSARVLFSSILHGSRYNFYWFPRVDNIRFEHSGEMNCNICRAKLAGIFSSGGSIDRKANNEHFRENRRGEARVEGESAKDD